MNVYRTREHDFREQAAHLSVRSRRLAQLRGAVFLGVALPLLAPALVPLEIWQASGLVRTAFLAMGTVVFGLFVVLHRNVKEQETRARQLAEINREARLRMNRRWKELPVVPTAPLAREHPLAKDLQLFGSASLSALLGTIGSPLGRELLGQWLLTPAHVERVSERQSRVQGLAPHLQERQELELAGRPLQRAKERPDQLLRWAGGGVGGEPGPFLAVLAWVVPVSLVGLFAAWLLGHPWGAFWAIPLLGAVVLTWRTSPGIHGMFKVTGVGGTQIEAYRDLLAGTQRLRGLEADHEPDAGTATEDPADGDALKALDGLRQWIHLSDLRSNGMLYALVQPFTLWDIHVARGMATWRRRHGHRLEGWLEEAAEMEALCALAALHHAHPNWAFPAVRSREETKDRVVATALGHPLLPDESRVDNDLEVGPGGTLLLVTGSNMAGKSTLLRALGLNLLLAAAGGPVCARRLSMPPVQLASSVQVQDSLEEGVSLFLAELQRIRSVVEGARVAGQETESLGSDGSPGYRDDDSPDFPGSRRPLYLVLLDEILRGTNSQDRQTAVRRVLRHLRDEGATGLITTHDLELAGESGLVPVHFRETVETRDGETRMTFDYVLRPGVAPTTNALLLLDAMGIRDPSLAGEPREGGSGEGGSFDTGQG
ncbi:MAG: hypothetical protein WEA09_12625 [Gemmatimonadota bacterium]